MAEVNLRDDTDVPEGLGYPVGGKLLFLVGTDGAETLIKAPLASTTLPTDTGGYTGGVLQPSDTTVQLALERLDAAIAAAGAGSSGWVLDTTNFDGILGATETTVQGALDVIDDVRAANIPVTASGNLSSTHVQAALLELQADIDALALSPDTGWAAISNALVDKNYDADNTTFNEVADVLAAVIQGLLNVGIFTP